MSVTRHMDVTLKSRATDPATGKLKTFRADVEFCAARTVRIDGVQDAVKIPEMVTIITDREHGFMSAHRDAAAAALGTANLCRTTFISGLGNGKRLVLTTWQKRED